MAKSLGLALLLASADGADVRRSFVFRHCIRATGSVIGNAKKGYNFIHDYMAEDMPEYGVPSMFCTKGGEEIIKHTAQILQERYNVTSDKCHDVHFYTDITQRDEATSSAMMKGLDCHKLKFADQDPAVIHAILLGRCKGPNPATVEAERKQRFELVKPPMDAIDALNELESIFGTGKAGHLSELGPLQVSEKGKLVGSANVLKKLSQILLYTHGSGHGLETYTNATVEQKFRLGQWVYYNRAIMEFNSKSATDNSYMLARVLADLERTDEYRSTFYLGHDTNHDGLASLLDLRWHAGIYGDNWATPPGVGLMFEHDVDAGKVEIKFLYTEFSGSNPGREDLEEKTVWSGTLTALKVLVESRLDLFEGARTCFEKGPFLGEEILV